ncbi:MAG: biotin--[acetyl-CoA-carboxylase] ligase [Parvularculaceae bacterium]
MPKRLSSGAAIEVFEDLDSTNSEARRRAKTGARAPLWIVALRQTAGYGRRARAWTQAEGDLAATLLLEPGRKLAEAGQLSFVAALAVAETIRAFAPRAPLSLKWPNDVLLDGGKIAGILPELLDVPSGRMIALGIGLNVVSKPADAAYKTARLIDALAGGAPPKPRALVEILDAKFAAWRDIWMKEGFAPARAAWLERAAGQGERILVRLPGNEIEGVFEDIDADGGMVLKTADSRRVVAAGEVFFTRRRA